MKLKATALLIVLSFCSFVIAQYPNINGISTNPANPINPQLPSKLNTFFNWQLERWQIKPLSNQGTCTRGDSLTSPFFRLDNAEELRVSKDMNWEDLPAGTYILTAITTKGVLKTKFIVAH